MTLEQEIASIMAFALANAGEVHPYYYDVPEQFSFPAMYFPQPEINTRGETFRTYAMEYVWYINVMCETTEEAHEKALGVLSALKRAKNLVPLIEQDGTKSGSNLRLDDPSLKTVDHGVAQITLGWTSRRPYDYDTAVKMQHWEVEGWNHPDVYVTRNVATAMESAINEYAKDYPHPEYAQEDAE